MESLPISVRFKKIPEGREVSLITQYDPQYTGGGAQGLVDHIYGGKEWKLGAWQGYNGVDFIAIIDLGKEENINRIGANFIQDTKSWIFLPEEVSYYISEDGKEFKLYQTLRNPISKLVERTEPYTFYTNEGFKARYIMVRAKNIGQNPDWHLSAGEKSWLFIDEIIIE